MAPERPERLVGWVTSSRLPRLMQRRPSFLGGPRCGTGVSWYGPAVSPVDHGEVTVEGVRWRHSRLARTIHSPE